MSSGGFFGQNPRYELGEGSEEKVGDPSIYQVDYFAIYAFISQDTHHPDMMQSSRLNDTHLPVIIDSRRGEGRYEENDDPEN